MNDISDPIYTLDEAAAKLGFSRKTLQREINAGWFPNSFKVGKRSCTRASDLELYQDRKKKADDEVAQKKAAEEAGRLRFQKEIEAFSRSTIPVFDPKWNPPGVRTFAQNDPNRLP